MSDGAALATILFTDLVGSTALRASLGEEAADEVRRIHDRLLSEAVQTNRGQVVKGSGDGVLAAFSSATDALNAAVAAQQALWRYNESAERLAELSVRMGLSVGDVSWEGGDCFGTPVIEAARLEAAAQGGEILCSEFVRVLARGRGGHRFVERGALALKGLAEPLSTCEVVWEPPASTGDAFPPALALAERAAFVGRGEVLERILTHLGAIDALRVVWISGEPGIGKTRLAAAVASRAAERGALVLLGHCDEELAFPYQPFAEALRDFVATDPPIAALGADPTALARLAPALSNLGSGIDPTSFDEADQRRLFEAVASWLSALSEQRRVLLVLDDLHWATASTAQMVRFVTRTLPAARLGIVVTMRDTEEAPGPARPLRDELMVRVESCSVDLIGLAPHAIGDLLGADEPSAMALFDQTGGNPLFLTLLSGEGQDVNAAIRRRTRTLSPGAAEVLSRAAVFGDEWDLALLAASLGRTVLEVLDDVEELRRAGLVGELGVGRFRFAHALVRQAMLDAAGPTRVAMAHLQVADAIEARPGGPEQLVGELAHHLVEARAVGADVGRVASALVRAGRLSAYQFDHEAAVEQFSSARQLLAQQGTPSERGYAEAVLGEGEARVRTTDLAGGFERLTEAIERAEAGGWLDLAVPAAMDHSRMSAWLGRPGALSAELLRRVLDRVPPADATQRSLLMSELARALSRSDEAATAPAVLAEALALARGSGDPRAQMVALSSHFHVYASAEARPLRHEAMREAAAIERHSGTSDPFSPGAGLLFIIAMESGKVPEARQQLSAFGRVGRAYRFYQLELLFCAAMLHVLDGAFVDAEACYEQARELASQMSGFDVEGIYGLQMFLLRREQGRLSEVAGALRMAARLGALDVSWQPGLAALYAELDLRQEARAVLDGLVVAGQVLLPNDSLLGGSLSFLADAAAVAGTASQAETLYRALLPWAGGCIMIGSVNACVGPADRFLALLAARAGRHREAEGHFEAAQALARGAGSALWSAQVAVSRAEYRDRLGDTTEGAALLRQAARLAESSQLGRVTAQVARLLAEYHT